MAIDILRITKNDTTLLRELNHVFGLTFEDIDTYNRQKPSDDYILSFLDDSKHIVLVAINDNKVIGGLVAYVITKFEIERKEVFIYDLAVLPQYQRLGVGRSLIDNVKRISKDIGAYVVFVQADEADEAIKFYESLHPDENIQTRNFDYLIH